MQFRTFFAQDELGNTVAATATVYEQGTNTKASIFSIDGTAIANPNISGSGGKFAFAAADGIYDLSIVAGPRSYSSVIEFLDVKDAIVEVSGLVDNAQTAETNAANSASTATTAASDAVSGHVALDDPHTQYALESATPVDVESTSDDVDTVFKSGFYRVTTNANLPSGAEYGQLIVSSGGDTILQLVSSYDGRLWQRSGNPSNVGGSGSYSDWQEISGKDSLQDSLQAADILVTVGTGGDYPTINAALEYLSKLQPVYDSAGITATINLLSGFVMAEQVLVRGLDLGWITITGADAETTIARRALTTDFTTADYGFSSSPAFGVSKGGVLPRIDQLFRFDFTNAGGNKHGIMAVGAGSSADVLAGAGVNDAGHHGIYAYRGATINADEANASGATFNGIYASRGSTINANRANASGAGYNGINASSGSTINADEAITSSAGYYGINASSGSTINADGANAYGAGTYGILASRGSTINANEAIASGAATSGIYAANGSTINANRANASGAGSYGILASRGATINAVGATGTLSQATNTVTGNGIIFQ